MTLPLFLACCESVLTCTQKLRAMHRLQSAQPSALPNFKRQDAESRSLTHHLRKYVSLLHSLLRCWQDQTPLYQKHWFTCLPPQPSVQRVAAWPGWPVPCATGSTLPDMFLRSPHTNMSDILYQRGRHLNPWHSMSVAMAEDQLKTWPA